MQKGGDGNDTFVAAVNDGDDSISGDAGTDTYDLSATRAGASVTTTKATSAEIGTDALSSVENVIGSQGNDTITLGDGNNVLTGLAGNDTLTGGRGADTFVFNNPSEGLDTITDFTRGQDVIKISAAGFGGELVANAPVTVAKAADIGSVSSPAGKGVFIFDNLGANAGTVYWDANGGSGIDAVAIVKLQGVTSLASSDFQVALLGQAIAGSAAMSANVSSGTVIQDAAPATFVQTLTQPLS